MTTDLSSFSRARIGGHDEAMSFFDHDGRRYFSVAYGGSGSPLALVVVHSFGFEHPTLHPLELTVAYQDSCHLRHAQRLPAAWRPVLERVPGLRVVQPSEQDICCGSAGIYNVTQPDAARELGDRKARHVLATEPDAYASANPGCLVQVAQALDRAGRSLPALHPVELLDASIRGVGAAELLAGARR